jgi:hypothetical protein
MSLKYRTNDSDRWGAGKGANLTPKEVDENFWDLLQRLLAVEENPAQPAQIGDIQIVGNAMTITLDDGVTTFGPFLLPQAAFTFTGDFQALHTYAVYDFLTANDGLYMVRLAHTSASTFDPAATQGGDPAYRLIMPFPNLYDLGFFFPGAPGLGIASGGAMFTFVANRAFYLQAGLSGSVARLETAATGALSFSIRKNATEIGKVEFATSATTGTFTFPAAIQFAAGDRLRVLRDTAVDDTAADLSINFAARKGTIGV